uniref:DUF4325 domain-containing protein n=1 Tax=Steinernema glaseri TaxID=37863 RepID=A0A1I7YWV8_9BILA
MHRRYDRGGQHTKEEPTSMRRPLLDTPPPSYPTIRSVLTIFDNGSIYVENVARNIVEILDNRPITNRFGRVIKVLYIILFDEDSTIGLRAYGSNVDRLLAVGALAPGLKIRFSNIIKRPAVEAYNRAVSNDELLFTDRSRAALL